MGIRIEIKQHYRGIECVFENMQEVKSFLDAVIPFMKTNFEIEVTFIEEEKEEEPDGE